MSPQQQENPTVDPQLPIDQESYLLVGKDWTDSSPTIHYDDASTPDSANDPDDIIVFKEEELNCIRETFKQLTEEHDLPPETINLKFLAYTCIVNKNRVPEATKNYVKFLQASKPLGVDRVETFEELWADPNVKESLNGYALAGPDFEGRSVFWVVGGDVDAEHIPSHIRAGILYTLAIHCDPKSLREGITFVIDSSKKSSSGGKHEAEFRKQNQCYPLRPQRIQIAGASPAFRVVVNTLLKVASVFVKQKILDRIRFVSLEEAKASIPNESVPKYLGGNGRGVDDIAEWVKMRLDKMPTPEL